MQVLLNDRNQFCSVEIYIHNNISAIIFKIIFHPTYYAFLGISINFYSNNYFYYILFFSFRIVQYSLKKHPDHCKFKTYITFPEIGFYKVEMFINSRCEMTYYVNSLKSGTIFLIDVYNRAREFIINEAAPIILNAVDETRQFVAN